MPVYLLTYLPVLPLTNLLTSLLSYLQACLDTEDDTV